MNTFKTRLGSRKFRSLAVAIAIGMASTLTFAGNSLADTSASPTPDAKSITAVFLSGGAYDPCSNTYAANFEKQYGTHVTVIHEGYPTMHDKLLTALASGGSTYDMMMIAYQWTGEFAPFLSPLTTVVSDNKALAGILPSATKSYQVDGIQYAVPFSAQAETMFYRTDLFKKAGLQRPTTWTAWESAVKLFTKNPDFPGIYGTSIKASDSNSESEFNTRYYGLGGKSLASATSKIDVRLATKALQLLKDDALLYSPPGARSATFSETSAQFQSGIIAMGEFMPTTITSLITAKTPANKVLGKVGVAVIAGGHGEMGGWGLAVPKSSPNQATAIKFAQYLSTESADHACFIGSGKSPVQAATYNAKDVRGLFYSKAIKASLGSSMPRPSGPNGGKINTMMTTVIGQFLSGQISSASDAASQMATQFAQLSK